MGLISADSRTRLSDQSKDPTFQRRDHGHAFGLQLCLVQRNLCLAETCFGSLNSRLCFTLFPCFIDQQAELLTQRVAAADRGIPFPLQRTGALSQFFDQGLRSIRFSKR